MDAIIGAWLKSLRIEEAGGEHRRRLSPTGYLLAVPHASLLIVAAHHRDAGLVTMVSRSRDGDRAARLLVGFGYRVVRGSTSRGGADALRRMRLLARDHRILGLTVDGPRGPAWKVQPGVAALASWTGLPILPAVGAGSCIRWPSWDRLVVLVPRARCRVHFGEPIFVAPTDDRMKVRRALESALGFLRDEAGL